MDWYNGPAQPMGDSGPGCGCGAKDGPSRPAVPIGGVVEKRIYVVQCQSAGARVVPGGRVLGGVTLAAPFMDEGGSDYFSQERININIENVDVSGFAAGAVYSVEVELFRE